MEMIYLAAVKLLYDKEKAFDVVALVCLIVHDGTFACW